jgi:hypothetical protein
MDCCNFLDTAQIVSSYNLVMLTMQTSTITYVKSIDVLQNHGRRPAGMLPAAAFWYYNKKDTDTVT